ncbi:MAG: 1-(5-phosphoribosyl)-5-[(5-phosphoribosylamino)methylideneamino]imidazole-4-carboxamide isomerase [Ruminococcaceae bacterium]|nr:1-(5-phosphoribosyl)-5-[(5-phosphoribosylamino)methylideneamino]imidazole-4-carboxamide isomerase [Oscillospiraceae bacterium]
MIIFPAIDLYGGQAVRLLHGDYDKMTVYSSDPLSVAADFSASGATHIHLVDLEGAKSGETPNIDTISKIVKTYGLFAEVGGGIRSMQTVDKYIGAGVSRVILGTAAVTDEDFLRAAVKKHGDKIAVGVDIKDGNVAIKGWTERSRFAAMDFCRKMESIGVANIICTDISRDGAMRGANHELYREMAKELLLKITASGGVSSLDDVKKLASLGIYGAIIGKAYYTGAIDLKEALEVSK